MITSPPVPNFSLVFCIIPFQTSLRIKIVLWPELKRRGNVSESTRNPSWLDFVWQLNTSGQESNNLVSSSAVSLTSSGPTKSWHDPGFPPLPREKDALRICIFESDRICETAARSPNLFLTSRLTKKNVLSGKYMKATMSLGWACTLEVSCCFLGLGGFLDTVSNFVSAQLRIFTPDLYIGYMESKLLFCLHSKASICDLDSKCQSQ